jgi:hypothetical protein
LKRNFDRFDFGAVVHRLEAKTLSTIKPLEHWIQNSIFFVKIERVKEMYTPEHLSPEDKSSEHGGSVTNNPDSNDSSIPH